VYSNIGFTVMVGCIQVLITW